MISIANHLWQSTLCFAAAGLVALLLRNNRAQVRYGVWLAASLKFLLPFSLLIMAGNHAAPRRDASPLPPAVSAAIEQVHQTFEPLPAPESPQPRRNWPILVWAAGFLAVAATWTSRWLRLRDVVRRGTRTDLAAPVPVITIPAAIEPGIFGILRPVLLIPEGLLDRVSPRQFSAIVAHEMCHVRRRDNLVSAIHMAVEALFWFHPAVWFIGARLTDERERACDEEVLRQGSEPVDYAEGILNVCKFYLQSPLDCAAGVSGADLRKRIEAILTHRAAPALTIPRRALLATVAASTAAVPFLIGMQERVEFEVVSIKPAPPDTGGPRALGFNFLPGGGVRGRMPVHFMITFAYGVNDFQVSGGPSWVGSDIYEIEARPGSDEAARDQTVEAVRERTRRRFQALLASRFRLSVRSESKESSVYVLAVDKGGPKLTPDEEGRSSVRTGSAQIEGQGAPVTFLANALTNLLRQPVLNETGITGKYRFDLTFRPDNFGPLEKLGAAIPPQDTTDDPRPSIFTAIRQLGLRLDVQKRPMPVIVIEHIEKPSEN